MKVKTTDQLHISSVQAGTIPAGTVIEVGDADGKSLIKRGLATKMANAPKNKAAPKPKNKGR